MIKHRIVILAATDSSQRPYLHWQEHVRR